MENENIRENENLNEEVVEETTTPEIVEEDSVNEDMAAESEIVADSTDVEDIIEEEPVEVEGEELIGDEWQQTEDVFETVPVEPMSEEEIAAIMAAKKKKRNLVILIAAVIAAIVTIAAVWVCRVEGVGGKTFVNTTISATETDKDAAKKDNIKFENPVMAVVNSIFGDKKDAVMVVNGKGVDKDVFTFATNVLGVNYIGSLAQLGLVSDIKDFDWNAIDTTSGVSYLEYAKGLAAENLVPIYAFIAEGEKRGVFLSEEEEKEIADGVAELKEQYGDDFETVLNQNGYPNEDAFVSFNRIQRHMNKIYQEAQVDIEKYVNKEDVAKKLDDGKITVKHILISFDSESAGEVTDEVKAEAKKKAEEVLEKVKNGEDFDKLIEEYNDDPGATSEGYTFADNGEMVQEFADAAFALEVGETSELVETTFGYHIIKRIDRNITVDDYISMLSKTCDIRVRRGNFSDVKITINLADYAAEDAQE